LTFSQNLPLVFPHWQKRKKNVPALYKTFLWIDENKNPAPHQHHFDITEGL
jgi:hypothetical protein